MSLLTPASWAWRQQLNPVTKLVLLAMADECDPHGFSHASRRHLAYKTELTEQVVADCLVELTSSNVVTGAGRICTPEGEEMDDVYFLNLDNTWDRAATPRMRPAGNDSCETQSWEADRARLEGQS